MNFNKKRTWVRAQLWPTRLFESTPSPSMANHRALIQLFVNQSCLGQGCALFNATLTGVWPLRPSQVSFHLQWDKRNDKKGKSNWTTHFFSGRLSFSTPASSRVSWRSANSRKRRLTVHSTEKKIVNCKRSWLTDRRCTNPIEKGLSQGKLNPSLSSSMET